MNVKRCSGYKGHWECGDDYPDHMVPREKFNKRPHHDGLQAACKKCHRYGAAAVRLKNNNKLVDITTRFKSEYGPSKPMTKRETVHVEGEVVPQGWVYVIRNTETPWLFKIGKTYPDGIQSRLSEARRWGCFKLEEKYWFEDALKAEKEVHAMLREHNMRNLGFEDCGTELFKCWNIGTITDAINKIIRKRVA
ncbi:MAG: hypothetical protein CBC83_08025 [Flavobacteriales bacterium TMED123]|nr:MAG: hypothetical protein CBC83_08025 [Flavobacteriales bacterium TMED123]|tara:strand:- start:874 stop:1452 length:579 start_codon:yes stop_codon:yes gene_type:complete